MIYTIPANRYFETQSSFLGIAGKADIAYLCTRFQTMTNMTVNKMNTILMGALLALPATTALAQDDNSTQQRLSLGGYGEAVMSRNFYSDHFNRYQFPEKYKDDGSHGRFDLPHVTLNMGYDFGHGWSMGMEIEFEHGGTESAVEVDADESGEYEAEVEKGGEVALEQFWIQRPSCGTVPRTAMHGAAWRSSAS